MKFKVVCPHAIRFFFLNGVVSSILNKIHLPKKGQCFCSTLANVSQTICFSKFKSITLTENCALYWPTS